MNHHDCIFKHDCNFKSLSSTFIMKQALKSFAGRLYAISVYDPYPVKETALSMTA